MEIKTVAGPGVGGIHPAELVVTVKAQEALTKNDICQFDFFTANSTTMNPGEDTSPFYLVRDPDTEGTSLRTLSCGIFGVAQENIAANATGKVMLRGITDMNVDGATVKGSCLVPAADGQGDVATGGTNFKVIAIALEADTSNVSKVLFDGLAGFGNDVGSNVST